MTPEPETTAGGLRRKAAITPAAIRRSQRFGRIFALRMQGRSISQIAADVGLTASGVVCAIRRGVLQKDRWRIAQRRGYDPCPECGLLKSRYARTCRSCYGRQQLSDARQHAAQLYEQGMTTSAIANAYGLSRERVCQYLRPLGIIRPPGCRRAWMTTTKARRQLQRGQRMYQRFLLKVTAVRLYLTGLTLRQVEMTLGLGLGRAQRLMPTSVTRPTGIRKGSRKIDGHWTYP